MKKLLLFLLLTGTFSTTQAQQVQEKKQELSLDQKLFTALDNKDIESAKSLIQQGANVNAAYDGSKYSKSKGMTVFIFAMLATSDVDFIRYLIAQGANPKANIAEDEGRTAIHYAAEYAMKKMLIFLIEETGLSINEENTHQMTPLSYAAQMRYENTEFMQFMIDKGAKVDYPNKLGGTALHWAIIRSKIRLVKVLVENGADINKLSAYGSTSTLKITPLGLAITRKNIPAFDYLLNAGADYQYANIKISPLHLAVLFEFPYGVNKLLALGLDTKRKDLYGRTPMQIAVEEGAKFEQRLLLYGPSDTDKKLFRLMGDESLSKFRFYVNNKLAKKVTVRDLDGNEVLVSEKYRGKLTLLNFWATWCGPCLQEMPSMESLKEKMGDQLQIVAVSVDKEKSKISEFDASRGPFPFIYLHDSEWKMYQEFNSALPGSYLLGKDGKILASISGSYTWDDPKVIELIEVLSQY